MRINYYVNTQLSPINLMPICNPRYNHIKSFGDLRKQFPAATGAKAAAAAKDDDDDVDLFGSDDEEVAIHVIY